MDKIKDGQDQGCLKSRMDKIKNGQDQGWKDQG